VSWRTPLWVKLAAFGALGVAATHSFHLIVSRDVASAALEQEQTARGVDVARLVARQASNAVLLEDRVLLQELVEQAAAGEHVSWCFITRDDEVLASSFPGGTPAALLTIRADGGTRGAMVVKDGQRRFLDVAAPILGGSAGEVRVGIDMETLSEARHDLGLLLGLVALLTIVVGTVAAFVVGRTLTAPVKQLLLATERFDPAAVPTPVPRSSTDELAELTERFNEMMHRLHAGHDAHQLALRKSASSERLVALGSLVAGVAHEVNNPLAGLKNVHSTLRRGDLTEAKQREYLELMGDALTRIEDIVRRLLDFGRPRPLALVPHRPSTLLREVVRLVAPAMRQRKVTLSEHLPEEDDQPVLADRLQVSQALLNLILNALYVTPDGEALELGLRAREGFRGLEVRDRGPGIPPELRERVLDPFFSTKPEGEGTGLGLTVTRTIADAHGGELSFEFPERGGTVVVLWLRVVSPGARP
jgi:two-component system NtrC family sensor kinase